MAAERPRSQPDPQRRRQPWPRLGQMRGRLGTGLTRLGTVRVRTTVAAMVVVGLAMAVGALVLVAVLHDNLTREVRTAARLQGQDVAAVLASSTPGPGRWPSTTPATPTSS